MILGTVASSHIEQDPVEAQRLAQRPEETIKGMDERFNAASLLAQFFWQ